MLLRESGYPNVRAKKLTDIAYKFDFAGPPAPPIKQSRRFQESAVRPPPMRGTFVDVLVLGKALLGEGRPSLAGLGKKLQVRHPKLKAPEFKRPITDEQLRYAVRDPLATAQCYFELRRRYAALELPTPLHRIYSEASVAKGYLDKMSILPWRQVQPNVDPTIIGYLMSTYVAGRTDTKIRREIRRVAVCDFTALYASGCVLLVLWKFSIAKGFPCLEATDDMRAFLNLVSLDDLQRPQTWPKMVGIAQIHPNEDVLPIRGRYGRRPGRRIGWNYFSQHKDDHLLWVTTLDLVASKILTGRVPKIIRGLTFSPLTPQEGLQTITLGDGFKFDPYADDFLRLLTSNVLR